MHLADDQQTQRCYDESESVLDSKELAIHGLLVSHSR